MKRELELYMHIPFCERKCAYCDFLSGTAGKEEQQAYFDALIREIHGCGDFSGYEVTSIFIGGGTPSVLDAEWIGRMMEEVRTRFNLRKNPEITIEINPGTVNKEKMRSYKQYGINRISFGCQSTDNNELKVLGRIHTWETFVKNYQMARSCGFDNINIDLMSGIPEQTVDSWIRTLEKIIELQPEHISAYSLIIEAGTPFYEKRNNLNLPNEEDERLMYEKTAEILGQNGYIQYEFSNYAKYGKECEHNVGYWTGREYLGLGLGASSLLGEKRFHNTEDIKSYLQHSQEPDILHQDVLCLSRENRIEEFMILGLRMTEGVLEREFQRRFDADVDDFYKDILDKYEKTGYLVRENGRISFSRKGISVSNRILSEFLF